MKDMPKRVLTLCFVVKDGQILLAMKKRGFGVGRWNGFGGKVETGETIKQAAMRETREEGKIELGEIRKLGVIDFEFQGKEEILEVHVFRADDFTGEPQETEEMRPQWFPLSEIPFDEMWSDDRYWFPHFLADRSFTARFLFDAFDQVVSWELKETD